MTGLPDCCRTSLEYAHDSNGDPVMRCFQCGQCFKIYPYNTQYKSL